MHKPFSIPNVARPAKRIVKTQHIETVIKRAPSKRSVLFGTWRRRNEKPSTPVVYSGIHHPDNRSH
jgi:hypothetical protein